MIQSLGDISGLVEGHKHENKTIQFWKTETKDKHPKVSGKNQSQTLSLLTFIVISIHDLLFNVFTLNAIIIFANH